MTSPIAGSTRRWIATAAGLGTVALWTACGILPPSSGDGGSTDLARADGGGAVDAQASDGGAVVEPKFASLYGGYLARCKSCHAPNAPGRTMDIETALDFTSVATAHKTITNGMASGLVGNHKGCNMAPFIRPKAAESLLLAVVDQDTRKAFDLVGFVDCDESAISDETVKTGMPQPPPSFVPALKKWIEGGAPND